MTYNPPPYQPPQGPLGYFPTGAPPPPRSGSTFARRASVPMFILAAMGLLCGLFMGTMPWLVPPEELAKNPMPLQPPPGSSLTTTQFVKMTLIGSACLMLIGAVTLAVCAAWVRRGTKASLVTSLILCILIALWMVVNVLASLMGGPLMLVGSACVGLVPGVPLALAIAWLVQALREAPTTAARQQHYAAQYWMMQQQAQGGAGYGYGYGAPPAPPMQPPPQQSLGPMPPPPGTTDAGPSQERPK